MHDRLDILWAERAITVQLVAYCRGVDRMDPELLASIAHEGCTIEHPPIHIGSWEGFVDALTALAPSTDHWFHLVGNVEVRLDGGDSAQVTSTFASLTRLTGGDSPKDYLLAGRYLDHFREIGGHWRLWRRMVVQDLHRTFLATQPRAPQGVHLGARGHDDPSYHQLVIGAPAGRRRPQ